MKKIANHTLILGATALFASLTFGDPPTPVSDMDKRELKVHKRDTKEYAFKTQTTKDKANSIIWVQSPVVSDRTNPQLRYYFRTAIKDGKAVANYLNIMQTRSGINEFDAESYDYTAIKLGDRPLQTQVGKPVYDPGSESTIYQSTVIIDFASIKSLSEKGMYLRAINSIGSTDIPIKPSLLSAFSERVEKEISKAKK